MDVHFEVILERVTELSEQSKTTVWYEIPPGRVNNLIVLINDRGDVGTIQIKYKDQLPTLIGYVLDKHTYEMLVDLKYNMTELKKEPDILISPHSAEQVVGIITNTV